mgnify:CR=1 FL=1
MLLPPPLARRPRRVVLVVEDDVILKDGVFDMVQKLVAHAEARASLARWAYGSLRCATRRVRLRRTPSTLPSRRARPWRFACAPRRVRALEGIHALWQPRKAVNGAWAARRSLFGSSLLPLVAPSLLAARVSRHWNFLSWRNSSR